MSVLDNLAKQAERLATDVQTSLRRARVEGERRLLARQHRTALEALGERAYELVRAGELPGGALADELAAVEARVAEIEAKEAEIASLEADEEMVVETAPEDPSRAAFPMVGGEPPAPTPGPGWEAAERFFADGEKKRS